MWEWIKSIKKKMDYCYKLSLLICWKILNYQDKIFKYIKFIKGILRISGFFNGAEKISDKEFQKILEERPMQREKQEKIIFKKLIMEIKKTSLDFDKYPYIYKIFPTSGHKQWQIGESVWVPVDSVQLQAELDSQRHQQYIQCAWQGQVWVVWSRSA